MRTIPHLIVQLRTEDPQAFPGDAQIENGAFTLKDKVLMRRLAEVTFYKVGYYGSRNATPKLSQVFEIPL